MQLTLHRKWFTDRSTIGELLIDGKFECYILEDVARAAGVKIKGITAIPEGEYKIQITYSSRFKRMLPLIFNKDDFSVEDRAHEWTGIRIHSGNDAQDTEGCLLPGTQRITDKVINSRIAFAPLFEKLSNATDKINLTIINDQI